MADRILDALKRDAKILDAIHRARYAMVILNGNTVIVEGEHFPIDFSAEIADLDVVMRMLNVDPSEPLPAPTREDPAND